MHVILGAAGHVGSACVEALLRQGQPVTAIVHHVGKGDGLKALGPMTAVTADDAEMPPEAETEKGETTLEAYILDLVARA